MITEVHARNRGEFKVGSVESSPHDLDSEESPPKKEKQKAEKKKGLKRL